MTTCWQDSSNNSKRLGGSTLYIGSFCWFPDMFYATCHWEDFKWDIIYITRTHYIFIGRWRFLKINKFDKNGISYCSINGGETGVSAASHLHVCRQQLRLAKLILCASMCCAGVEKFGSGSRIQMLEMCASVE